MPLAACISSMGLLLDIIGVVVIGLSVIRTNKQIEDDAKLLGMGALANIDQRTKEAFIDDRKRQRRWVIFGTILLIVGFALQFFGRLYPAL